MSIRANAESTLSRIPFLSSPIGAKRNSLNSDPKAEPVPGKAALVISSAVFCRRYRTGLTGEEARLLRCRIPGI
jgi:hypothetical protein